MVTCVSLATSFGHLRENGKCLSTGPPGCWEQESKGGQRGSWASLGSAEVWMRLECVTQTFVSRR